MDVVGLIDGEKVQVVNNNNGECLEMYVIEGEWGFGVICFNGVVVWWVQVGDIVIIIVYVWMLEEEVKVYQLKVVFLIDDNWLLG